MIVSCSVVIFIHFFSLKHEEREKESNLAARYRTTYYFPIAHPDWLHESVWKWNLKGQKIARQDCRDPMIRRQSDQFTVIPRREKKKKKNDWVARTDRSHNRPSSFVIKFVRRLGLTIQLSWLNDRALKKFWFAMQHLTARLAGRATSLSSFLNPPWNDFQSCVCVCAWWSDVLTQTENPLF